MSTSVVETAYESGGASERRDLKALLVEYERELIRQALEATGGNQRQAARRLGVLPTTLNEKMKRLGLRRPEDGERITEPVP
jgi:DNA-binding NtrC family response regulator